MYTVGIDIGSTSCKAVALKDGSEIIGKTIIQTGTGTSGPERVYEEIFKVSNIRPEDVARTVVTGYGRMTFNKADGQVSELSCHAKGVFFLMPNARTVIDIGGQDAKALKLSPKGTLLGFVMNDKCAAGTGRFLDVMAKVLEVATDELAGLSDESTVRVSISNICTVFAESEVISQLAAGQTRADIAAGIHKLEAGVVFLKSEYARVLEALEEVAGTKVSNEAVAEAITVFNANRQALRSFVELAVDHADIITPVVRHNVIKSGYFIEKPEHTALVNELCAALEAAPKKRADKTVLLSGITAEPESLLNILSDCGLSVASDDLAQETRQFRYDVPVVGGDALYNLAKWWQIFEGCSLAYDPEKRRTDMIIEEVKRLEIKGVILLIMKFCDPEEYDYPLIKEALDANGIPSLYFEVDQPSDINAQAQTRIQAFSEILN